MLRITLKVDINAADYSLFYSHLLSVAAKAHCKNVRAILGLAGGRRCKQSAELDRLLWAGTGRNYVRQIRFLVELQRAFAYSVCIYRIILFTYHSRLHCLVPSESSTCALQADMDPVNAEQIAALAQNLMGGASHVHPAPQPAGSSFAQNSCSGTTAL